MHRKFTTLAITSVCLLGLSACGGGSSKQQTNVPPPQPAPLDYQALLNDTVSDVLPGIVLHIESPDKTVLLSAGLSDIASQSPMQVDAQMPVGSAGKKATALLALMLHEDGLLDIDDSLDTWLPTELVDRIEYGADITLRQLLTHTAGVHDYLAPDTAEAWFEAIMTDPTSLKTDAYALAFSIDKAADFAPGTNFNYSNSGYLLTGLILDSVLGEHHSAALRERVLIPLGMNNTYYNGVEKALGQIISGYFNLNGEVLNTKEAYENIGVADAPLVSTVEDMTLLLRAIATDDTIVSSSIRELMIGDENLTDIGDDVYYGMGMMKDIINGLPVYHHGGDEPGYATTNLYIPHNDTSITVFVNCGVAQDCENEQNVLVQTILNNEF